MYVPCPSESVRVSGRNGLFLVVCVNLEQREADLIPLHTAVSAVEGISFSELESFSEDFPLESSSSLSDTPK